MDETRSSDGETDGGETDDEAADGDDRINERLDRVVNFLATYLP